MRRALFIMILSVIWAGCSASVHFRQTNDDYVLKAKPAGSKVIFKQDEVERPHEVIGIIEAELGKHSRRPDLNRLIIRKAREIGADGVMLVEYDVDRDVYVRRHHRVVGRGPHRRHVVRKHPEVHVRKTASAVAFIFR